jgi:manganese transport protein
MFALTINASILILAAAAFNATGNSEVADLDKAHALLSPVLGSVWAPTLFAIALLCCGLNSTVTATMAGQIVMEGFLRLRLPPYLRRLITRGIAIVPAAVVTIAYGESGAGKLLIFSQVLLSLQLPFAVIPLVMMTADRRKMGALTAPVWLVIAASVISVLIVGLNLKLLFDFATGGLG